MMLDPTESEELAKNLTVGKNYRMTVTDCCIGGVEFQGKFMGEENDCLMFMNSLGDRALLYDWAIPGDLEVIG
jgi:hypothetical protein